MPAQQFTFTNTDQQVRWPSATSRSAAPTPAATGSPSATSFTLAPGGSALVSVDFHPDRTRPAARSPPTRTAIGTNVDQVRDAHLHHQRRRPADRLGDLSGVNACFLGGNGEPVLDQLLAGLGYTDVRRHAVHRPPLHRPAALPAGHRRDPVAVLRRGQRRPPVSLVPLAHYAGSTNTGRLPGTGYYAQGAAMTQPKSTCTAACNHAVSTSRADPSATTYNQNQKLLPIRQPAPRPSRPTGTFGLFSGDFSDVNFSDDGLNVGHTARTNDAAAGGALPARHAGLPGVRARPRRDPQHLPRRPIDINRVPAYKNNDYQDVVLLLSNVAPAVAQGPVISGTSDTSTSPPAARSSADCAVTGFDGVLDNTCVPSATLHISGQPGLSITSTRRPARQQQPAERALQDVRRDPQPVHRHRPGRRRHQPADHRLPADRRVLRPRPEQLRQGRGRAQRRRLART